MTTRIKRKYSILPPAATLAAMRKKGMTYKQITDKVSADLGYPVSQAGVTSAITRSGLALDVGRVRTAKKYPEEIPWTLPREHAMAWPVRMLRLLGKRRTGAELSEYRAGQLDPWLKMLAAYNLVVGYCPEIGFVYIADVYQDGPTGVPIHVALIPQDSLLNPLLPQQWGKKLVIHRMSESQPST